MLNFVIKCDGCGKELSIADSKSRLADEIIIKIVPCGESDCIDCSECEDIEDYQKQIVELQQQIDELKDELKKEE